MTATRAPAEEIDPTGSQQEEDAVHRATVATGVDAVPGYVLTLYVASLTPRSVVAIQSVKEVCERHLQGRYRLEVVDIYEHPSEAKREQILAAPTLIKHLPLPLRRLIGDMADEQRVLVGLDLRPRTDTSNPST
jgi:circadian clock protein KaiB